MKTNVVYLNQEFNVNPEKQAVHCRLIYGINLDSIPGIQLLDNSDIFKDYIDDLSNPYNGICEYYDEAVEDRTGTIFYTDRGWLIFETEGISKCAPNDNFNAELGKKVASTRAQENAFKDANMFYEDIKTIVNAEFNGLDTVIRGTLNAINKCKKHVCDLTGHTPIIYPKKK